MNAFATVTLNPCIDKTLYFYSEFRTGTLNRAKHSVMNPGGKGVNVSRVFRQFDIDVPMFGIAGGETGKLFQELLMREGIHSSFAKSAAETRLCIKMIDSMGVCTEANEAGGPFSAEEYEEFEKKLLSYVEHSDTTVFLGGSIPEGIPKYAYRDLGNKLKARNANVVLDADGEALRYGLEAHPMLIKPNDAELARLTGKEITGDTPEERVYSAARIAKDAAKTYETEILCTLGADGALWTNGKTAYRVNAPNVPLRGFTGAGDTFLAAYFLCRAPGSCTPVPIALRAGASAAAAKVSMPGTQIPDRDQLQDYYDRTKAVELKI